MEQTVQKEFRECTPDKDIRHLVSRTDLIDNTDITINLNQVKAVKFTKT